jgi:hypothetical protein
VSNFGHRDPRPVEKSVAAVQSIQSPLMATAHEVPPWPSLVLLIDPA